MEFYSVYTTTVIVTPYRGAGRPQGVFAMERTMDRIAETLGLDRAEVRAANFIQPDEFPYDQGLIFQDGRPLIYDSGNYPAQLDMIKDMIGWDDFAGTQAEAAAAGRRLLGIGLGCYVEGTGPGPVRGRAHPGADRRHASRSRSGSPRRARATRRFSRRSWRTNSGCRSSRSGSPPATPVDSVTRSALSPPARR